MKQKNIIDFKRGDTVQGFFVIKTAALKTSNNNNKYMDYTLGDRTGEINGKHWDYDPVRDGEYCEGMLVKIRGTVTEWQNQLQFKIERIRHCQPSDSVRIEDYVQTAPFAPEDMLGDILKFVIRIKSRDIREIVSAMINENREKLMHYPAAMKNHHSIRSGLLYHMLTMLKMAEKVMEVYDFLNPDLLYAGVILHDMAKINEMEANEMGIVNSYTTEGMLLGHIIQGIKDIERIGEAIGAHRETVILLEHMVLAHHYEPEFGSPKRPMIPEAEILHYLDVIDARMFDMRKALEPVEVGGFSDRVWLLHNRQLYKPCPAPETDSGEDDKRQA
jgi:3'-5' exoribonuclease